MRFLMYLSFTAVHGISMEGGDQPYLPELFQLEKAVGAGDVEKVKSLLDILPAEVLGCSRPHEGNIPNYWADLARLGIRVDALNPSQEILHLVLNKMRPQDVAKKSEAGYSTLQLASEHASVTVQNNLWSNSVVHALASRTTLDDIVYCLHHLFRQYHDVRFGYQKAALKDCIKRLYQIALARFGPQELYHHLNQRVARQAETLQGHAPILLSSHNPLQQLWNRDLPGGLQEIIMGHFCPGALQRHLKRREARKHLM